MSVSDEAADSLSRALTDANRAIEKMASERDALRAEVERLRQAIERHRDDVWGDGPVGHPDDVKLYVAAALSSPPSGG